jgi:hypothetical protein
MLGIRAAMDENELIQILGSDPVHMAQKGYQLLADGLVRMVETNSTAFSGGEERERRGRGGRGHRKLPQEEARVALQRGQEDGSRASRPRRSAWRRGKEEDRGRALEHSPLERKAVITRSSFTSCPTF